MIRFRRYIIENSSRFHIGELTLILLRKGSGYFVILLLLKIGEKTQQPLVPFFFTCK
jgi:hypothetical protein